VCEPIRCPNPIEAFARTQIQLLDPTGARRRLFSKANPERAKVGDILLVRLKTGDPFAGVCLNIRRGTPGQGVRIDAAGRMLEVDGSLVGGTGGATKEAEEDMAKAAARMKVGNAARSGEGGTQSVVQEKKMWEHGALSVDAAVLLRNTVARTGVESWFKIFSPNVVGVEVVQRASRRMKRARAYYMR
jgi:hypothetical protein